MSYMGKVRPTVALTSSDIVDGAITTDKVVDDAVTADKVANAINTSIAANTSKVTNATHTGDVTGATALTIATDAVDIAMLSATGTADATTFLRGDNAWTAIAGGLSDSSQWKLTTDFTGDANPIASNLTVVDGADGYGSLGSAMTESSGIFSFPSTGYWLIIAVGAWEGNAESIYNNMRIDTTTDDTTYQGATTASVGLYPSSGHGMGSTAAFFQFDVTDVSTHKVRFHVDVHAAGTTTMGTAGSIETGFTFIKLGDT